ncbi:MAG: nucleotidyltransferase domain-containing protein [Candidatus Yanofskybacteria bacterium]|nr:nucleotidyltransferase domain-containing protein [Candidatus Yanofskybacteria bacterium]
MKYLNEIKNTILSIDPAADNQYFFFGSFVKDKNFHDIDLGVVGNTKSRKNLSELRDEFYDSAIPYKVDVVDIDEADSEFRNYILNKEKIVWLKLK